MPIVCVTLCGVDSFADFIPRLIDARRSYGMTQGDVAEAIGLAPRTVTSWERGYRHPSADHAQQWAAVVGLTLPENTAGWFKRATQFDVAPCGTRPGYQRHKRNVEEACTPCLEASAAWHREYRALRAQRRAA